MLLCLWVPIEGTQAKNRTAEGSFRFFEVTKEKFFKRNALKMVKKQRPFKDPFAQLTRISLARALGLFSIKSTNILAKKLPPSALVLWKSDCHCLKSPIFESLSSGCDSASNLRACVDELIPGYFLSSEFHFNYSEGEELQVDDTHLCSVDF